LIPIMLTKSGVLIELELDHKVPILRVDSKQHDRLPYNYVRLFRRMMGKTQKERSYDYDVAHLAIDESAPHIEEVFDDNMICPPCESESGEVGDTAYPARLEGDPEAVDEWEMEVSDPPDAAKGDVVPVAKDDEIEIQRMKREAKSPEHRCIHEPKNRFCPHCQCSDMRVQTCNGFGP